MKHFYWTITALCSLALCMAGAADGARHTFPCHSRFFFLGIHVAVAGFNFCVTFCFPYLQFYMLSQTFLYIWFAALFTFRIWVSLLTHR